LRATNMLLAGKTIVVGGYGWCGQGLARRARGLGAQVIVLEVNPIKALEAKLEGYEVMPALRAAELGDIFVISTGNVNILDRVHFERMKDGAILSNAGHFDVEINVTALRSMATSRRILRTHIEELTMSDGRRLHLLCDGRLTNLIASEGHPDAVMDMSFANQALAAEYIAKNYQNLQNKVYDLPKEVDTEIARIKLDAMNVQYDTMTDEQTTYLHSWQVGT